MQNKIIRNREIAMESLHVKSEPLEEENCIDIEEHAIKLEPGDDQLDCLPQNERMEGSQGPLEEMLSIEMETSQEDLQLDSPRPGISSQNDKKVVKKCEECGIGFSNPEMLAWHNRNCHGPHATVRVVTGMKTLKYECTRCQFEHMTTELIVRHLRSAHNFRDLPFQCQFCTNSFVIKRTLIKHQSKCMLNQNVTSDRMKENCHECGVGFSNPEMLAWHVRHSHGPDAVMTVLKNSHYECNLCRFKQVRTELMIKHLRAAHNFRDLPFQCQFCTQSFIIKTHLSKHLSKCVPGQHVDRSRENCDQCGIGFTNSEMLAWHSRNCHGPHAVVKVLDNLKYECQMCKTEHTKTELVIQHLRAAHGFSDLPFKCPDCPKSFVMRHNLNKHESACKSRRTVDGVFIRNLKCGHCEMKFVHHEMLVWHIENCHGVDATVKVVTVGDKRTFQCLLCNDVEYGEFYRTISHLRHQHKLSKLPFHCVCEKQFITWNALKNHAPKCKRGKSLAQTVENVPFEEVLISDIKVEPEDVEELASESLDV